MSRVLGKIKSAALSCQGETCDALAAWEWRLESLDGEGTGWCICSCRARTLSVALRVVVITGRTRLSKQENKEAKKEVEHCWSDKIRGFSGQRLSTLLIVGIFNRQQDL